MKAIPYGRQHITEEDIAEVARVLRSDILTQGPEVALFENAFAGYVTAEHAIAVANGTAALHLGVAALGTTAGKKVLTTPVTFAATANAVLYCGGSVDFADIHPGTFLPDQNAARKKLEAARPGEYCGIITVDLGGLPGDMAGWRALADEFKLWIIEDASHSPGAFFPGKNGKPQSVGGGSFADLTTFSFHPVKHIACGEGGMLTTDDAELARHLKLLRTHGIEKDPARMQKSDGGWYYEMQELGFNYRLTDFQAALGKSQLSRAAANLERRKQIAKKYQEAFAGTSIHTQKIPEGFGHAWHLFIIRVDNRNALYDYLKSQGIHAQVHYIPLHLQPYYRSLGFRPGDFPEAESYYSSCLSLPLFPSLSDEDQLFVIEKVKEFCLK